jgi:hypothetical protein
VAGEGEVGEEDVVGEEKEKEREKGKLPVLLGLHEEVEKAPRGKEESAVNP